MFDLRFVLMEAEVSDKNLLYEAPPVTEDLVVGRDHLLSLPRLFPTSALLAEKLLAEKLNSVYP
jgi:hypothetical protein